MFIQFSDQAWSVYSDDAEKDGVISQYINFLIDKVRNGNESLIAATGEKCSQAGEMVVRYEITSDRVIIKSIVDAKEFINDRASHGDIHKYRNTLNKVPDVPPLEFDL
ncbi:hypothetical protein [Butyrivibrio proteoclasticus]|uniref:hypothetical protein n=1 Tax=Butyrivibrio proteoclasticus TaxID=43305 RepID=UPI00047B9D79|nr:hypothetical protein [Butyrivibrio proteoclasticus]